MKKRIIAVLLSVSLLSTSCLGSFSAFNSLKDWNTGLTDSKFLDNLIFWVLNIIPVYGLFFFGDVIIFNVVEFWTGSNPIAMNEGDMETQIVEKDGNKFQMIATKNRFQITVIEGERKGEKLDLVFSPSEKSWKAIKPNGEVIKLNSYEDGLLVMHLPDGEKIKIDPARTSREEGLAILQNEIAIYQRECLVLAEN